MVDDEPLLSIGEVAKISGVSASALRYYERCELIEAGIKVGGRRHYAASVLHTIAIIKFCQRIGCSLAEIGDLLAEGHIHTGEWRRLAMKKRCDVLSKIDQLKNLAKLIQDVLDCECDALCECPHMTSAAFVTGDLGGDLQI